MMLQNIHHQNIFRTNVQAPNAQLANLVNNINAKIQQNYQNLDTVEISMKARQLGEKADKSKEATIDYENSPMNGTRTEAEWAESSLTQKRNGVSYVGDELNYQKERLETIVSKIAYYDKIANGALAQEDGVMISKERASELAERYRESIKTDFSKEIENAFSFYNDWAKTYDQFSNGLASSVLGDGFDNISAESLGLNNLPDDPAEIMKALNNATEKLQNIAKSIEDRFFEASGKTMKESVSTKNGWERRLGLEFMLTEAATIDQNTPLSGKTLQIEPDLFR